MRSYIERLRVLLAKKIGHVGLESGLGGLKGSLKAAASLGFAQLRPRMIDVPTEDPFQNDRLERREFGAAVCRLLSYGSNSGVVILDGAWGTGKSTFLKMLAKQARRSDEIREAMIAVEINAWENDAFGEPIEHIAGNLQQGLAAQTAGHLPRNRFRRMWLRIKGIPIEIARYPGISNLGETILRYSWVKNVEPAIAALNMLALLGKMANCTGGHENNLQNLRWKLAHEAERLYRYRKPGVPSRIVVIVDELDRCRPDYAVRFLETIKHVFEIDHIAYLIAINREQLIYSMKGVYGESFDAEGYLERFGDVWLRFPDASRENFVRGVVDYMSLEAVLPGDIHEDVALEGVTVTDMLVVVLGRAKHLNLREIEKIVSEIRAMLCVAREGIERYTMAVIVAALARHVTPNAYAALLRPSDNPDAAGQAFVAAISGTVRSPAPVAGEIDPALTLARDLLRCIYEDGHGQATAVGRAKMENELLARLDGRRHLVDYRVVRNAIELYGSGVYKDKDRRTKQL
ncbi:MAG: P-loop NTPase fold protein [Gemmatimonadetes bacterium]|nr:P-loop NTPase fold protein [Gemmatimonadota bacterium]